MDPARAKVYVTEGLEHLFRNMNEVENVRDTSHCDPYNHAPLFPAVTHILDVTYIPVARGGVDCGNLNYSSYYGKDVVKVQVAINAYGLVSYVTGPHPGSESDSSLWGTSKDTSHAFHPNLDAHHVVMGDGAYAGAWRCVIATRRVGGTGDENRVGPLQQSILPRVDCREYDGAHNLIRMRVERAIARLKVFRILTYQWLRLTTVNDLKEMTACVSIVANLHNFMCKYALPELPVGPYPNKVPDFVPCRGEAPTPAEDEEDAEEGTPRKSSGRTPQVPDTSRQGDEDEDDEYDLETLTAEIAGGRSVSDPFPVEAEEEGDDVMDSLLDATRSDDECAEWHDL
eukprot:TRINITY_DN12405_c0_g1_i1.p1 TRINITY_DN12405_c0_g1~~TRINITY_DN12405_c0_g1_i1.p1  ORF type:complete len:366 (-),score=89.40 TRINITY_DN12405_c0_g1_i1:1532-2557(-)